MAGRARILPLVASSAAAAAVACNLLTGLDADYTPQTNTPGDETRVGDGGDGGLDVDAREPLRADGGDGGDGDATAFSCNSIDAGTNGFCWDFEEPTGPPKWGWDDSLVVRGHLVVVPGIGVNGSKGLRASVTDPGTTSGQAYLHHAIAGSKFTDFRHHAMSFSYAITKGTPLYTAALGALGFGGSGGQYVGASIYAAGATPGLIDISDPPGSATGTSIPVVIGEWKRVRIAMDRAGDSGTYTATVSVNGTQVQETPAPPFNAGSSTAPTQVWVGTFFSSLGDGGVEAVIDDVLVQQSN